MDTYIQKYHFGADAECIFILLKFLYDFYEASSQCYNGVVEINSIISKNWNITTRISACVKPSARSGHQRRWTMHIYIPKYLVDFYEAPTQCSNTVVEII